MKKSTKKNKEKLEKLFNLEICELLFSKEICSKLIEQVKHLIKLLFIILLVLLIYFKC